MPIMKVCAIDGVAKKMHVFGQTTARNTKVDRSMLNGIKAKSIKLKDMGGFDPNAEADAQMTKKTLGGMAGGAGVGFMIGGPIGALVGGIVGAVGGATAGLVSDIKKNNKKK